MSTPGKIRNPKAQSIMRDYSGLNFDGATPTDIDGFIWLDPWFFFLELKYSHATIYGGQRRAFEKLADAVGPYCVFILADHDISWDTPGIEIIAANCIVRSWYGGGSGKWESWDENEPQMTVRQLIDAIREQAEN
jgi:hypothetical protein